MSNKKIEALLLEKIGLQAETLGKDAVMDAARVRMTVRKISDAAAYLRLLGDDHEELQALIEEVVVSETWFFREPAAYQLLKDRLAAAAPASTIYVACIPCATGEEPYSVVMTLLEAGYSAGQIEVHGVDVSQRALNVAGLARYRPNSFRGEHEPFMKYFERHDGLFHLSRRVRDRVQLRAGNVLDPKLFAGMKFHAVFCRNLLIYLDRKSRQAALENLMRMLRPEGLLFVGHSEAGDVASHGLMRTGDPRSFAFAHGAIRSSQRDERFASGNSGRPMHSKPVLRGPQSQPISMRKAPSIRPRRSFRPGSLRPLAQAPAWTGEVLEQARELANRGQLHDALSACQRGLLYGSHQADLHSLLGIVQRALGDARAARASLMRAIELDPQHHEALFHLGLLCESEGDARAAGHYRERARAKRSQP